jgi:Na+-transporting methylmalonyl-CoA/oxaloacetate decarboxylase gamma subunit
MKRLLVLFILVAFVGAVAFASLRSIDKKPDAEKKVEKKEIKKKKECKRTCWMSA